MVCQRIIIHQDSRGDQGMGWGAIMLFTLLTLLTLLSLLYGVECHYATYLFTELYLPYFTYFTLLYFIQSLRALRQARE